MATDVYLSRDTWEPKFFLVDDQELNIGLLERILKRQGFVDIDSTTDSTEALERILAFEPDMILIDYHMPVKNGIDILNELKEVIPASVYLPIIVLTADTSAEAKKLALSQGAKDFLAKPFDKTEVVLRIQNLLDTRFLYLQLQRQNRDLEDALTQLKGAQAQLVSNEKMASLGQLTAGIAHEINNPINFVSSNIGSVRQDITDLLTLLGAYEEAVSRHGLGSQFAEVQALREQLEEEVLIEELSELLDGIEEGANRTAEIVKDLRNFSRLDEDDLKQASVQEGIDATLMLLKSTYEPRVSIIREYDDCPPIDCYPGKLNQVFMNLLVNAIQAIPDTGTIRIQVRHVADEVEISIRDTGVGMSEEVMNRVFEPFYTTKDVGVGTGLGLSITFGIIERHHGSIQVSSVIGEGTTFVLRLPVRQE